MGDRLKDKVALVSGAPSGGACWGNRKAAAVLFATEAAKVLAVDINRPSARDTSAEAASPMPPSPSMGDY